MPADAFTSSLGRYFGSELLLFSAALWALRDVHDPAAQRKTAIGRSRCTPRSLAP